MREDIKAALAFLRQHPALKAQLDAPPGFEYDPRTRRYHNVQTRQFVPFRVVYGLLETNEAASATVMVNLTMQLYAGELPGSLWLAAMQRQLRALHVQNAALGAGGLNQLTASDYIRIDDALRDDVKRLERFGLQVGNGELSLAQIQNRVNMYAGNARKQFFKARRPPQVQAHEMVIERRILRPGESCEWCVYLANLGWQPYGVLPVPGESNDEWDGDQCLTNCRCEMEQRVIYRIEAKVLLGPLVSFQRMQ